MNLSAQRQPGAQQQADDQGAARQQASDDAQPAQLARLKGQGTITDAGPEAEEDRIPGA